jgi:transposase InsO family protein
MPVNLDLALLTVVRLVYHATSRACVRLRESTEFGDLRAQVRLLREEAARLQAENAILRARLARLDPSCRPHYPKHERFEILLYRQRWGLTLAEAARAFLVTPATIARWIRLQASGTSGLVVARRALNRLSDLTRELVHRLALEQADWGTQRVCDVLVRLGLTLSRSSVQRIKREKPVRKPRPRPDRGSLGRPVVAKYPMHLWYTDLTSIRLPFVREIFIGAIVDGFSRKVLAIRAWARVPKAADVRAMLREAIGIFGAPKYLITDRGCQFKADALSEFLARRGILRRYGAVAKWQSVAKIDRFFGSLKREYAGRCMLLLPIARVNDIAVRLIPHELFAA